MLQGQLSLFSEERRLFLSSGQPQMFKAAASPTVI
jgi:hypothetical protein